MRLNGFDLNQVLCLDALLTERSVSRAATRVHLSQSAMSWVLAQLREQFKDPLLVRSGKHLVLTPFGQSLAGPVSEFLARAYALTSLSPDQLPVDIDRELRIVASDYSVATFLTPALRNAMQQMPKLRFDLLPLTTISSTALLAGEIDILFAGESLNVGIPPNDTLYEEEFACLVCRHKGIQGKTLSPERYMQSGHVVLRYFEHRSNFEDEDALRRQGLKRKQHIAVSSATEVAPLIVNSPLIGTVPRRIAVIAAKKWPLKIMEFPFEHHPFRHCAYWHASRNDDPIVQRFLSLVRDVV